MRLTNADDMQIRDNDEINPFSDASTMLDGLLLENNTCQSNKDCL